jgi:hypothetical protein
MLSGRFLDRCNIEFIIISVSTNLVGDPDLLSPFKDVNQSSLFERHY